MNDIKKLPHHFKGKGEVKDYSFTKIEESDKAFIYEKEFIKGEKSYEVFKKEVNRRFSSEQYPKSNHFGFWAWEYSNFDSAIRRFNELNH